MLRRTAAIFIAVTLLCWLAAGWLLNTAAAAPTTSRPASAGLQGDETATPSPTGPPSTNITLSGYVYDLSIGPSAVISGAEVSVLACQPRRFSTETGPDGYYSLFLPGQYLTGCEQVLLEAYAPGYGFLVQPLAIAGLRADPITNIPLLPAATVTPTASLTATIPPATDTPAPSETGTGTPMPDLTATPTATPDIAETGTATATAEAATGTPTPTATGTATVLAEVTTTATATPFAITTETATPAVTRTTTPTTPTLLTFKQARPNPVEPGEVVTFTIGLINDMLDTFDPGASVTVYDPVPMSLTVLSDTLPSGAVYDPPTNAVTWHGSVPQGLSTSLTFRARAALEASGVITNTAIITDALGAVYQPSAAVIIAIPPQGTATSTATATSTPAVTTTSTPEATGTPTVQPTGTGTPEMTGTPTPEVTETATPETTGTPTIEATETTTPEATGTPTVEATGTPTIQATGTATLQATGTPTATSTTEVCQSGTVQINIQDFAFVPQTVTVCQGATVRWTNLDTVPHTSTSDTAVWDSGVLNTGQSFSFTFNATGTFPYHCAIHPDMHGTINVVAAPGATGTPTVAATETGTPEATGTPTVEATGTGTPVTTGTPTAVPSTGTATIVPATATATIAATVTATVTATAAPSGTATVTATATPRAQLWLPLIVRSSTVRQTEAAPLVRTASVWDIFGWLRGMIGG